MNVTHKGIKKTEIPNQENGLTSRIAMDLTITDFSYAEKRRLINWDYNKQRVKIESTEKSRAIGWYQIQEKTMWLILKTIWEPKQTTNIKMADLKQIKIYIYIFKKSL